MKDLLRVARLALPLWRWVLLGVFLSLATTLAHIGLLALSSWFIASMAIAGIAGAVMNYSTPSAGVRALAIARAGGRYAERLVNHDTTFRILAALRVWFFRRIEPLAPAALQLRRGGDLLSRARADIDTLDDFYVRGVIPSLVALLSVGCIFPFLFHFDARLAVVSLAGLVSAGAILPLGISRRAGRPGRERVEWAADLRACIVEQIQGMAELEALGAGEFQAARITEAEREMDRRQRRLNSLDGIAEAQITAVSTLAAGAAALILAQRVGEAGLPGPDLAMLTVVVLASFETVRPLPGVLQRLGEMAAAARRLFEIIDEKPKVAETVAARPVGSPDHGVSAPVDLIIRDLRFRYSPDFPWVLRGLSLEAPAGIRLGVAGPTGAGKSTFVWVLLRFWEYEDGSIRVVFHDAGSPREEELRSLGSEEARALFSVVPQSPYLFHASIRENLLLANPAARDEELWSALDSAALSGMVSSLPAGLDTIVGETGREISGGEAQRLAVARALLRDAPAYVFDEPTEGLDDRTAETMLASIDRRLSGRTLIIISHRPRDHRGVSRTHRLELPGERSP
ncbi:MAG TPA: thiol reductant ABC exporter subunit CydC [Spirochaetia bacterium]|nr:thiol reductant ABC exporter subunit CydC [Spirochaetia bacterium]